MQKVVLAGLGVGGWGMKRKPCLGRYTGDIFEYILCPLLVWWAAGIFIAVGGREWAGIPKAFMYVHAEGRILVKKDTHRQLRFRQRKSSMGFALVFANQAVWLLVGGRWGGSGISSAESM